MFHKSASRKPKTAEDAVNGTNSHFNPQYKARSTSQLLSPNSVIIPSTSSKSDRSAPHASTSSLAASNSTKSNLSSLFKNPVSTRKTTISQSAEDRFIMTLIKTPIDTSPRIPSNSSADMMNSLATTPVNEDSAANNKFFKSKVTAAFNHMKYRKFDDVLLRPPLCCLSQGWAVRMRPNFRTNESPIYFLGKVYNGKEGTTQLTPAFSLKTVCTAR